MSKTRLTITLDFAVYEKLPHRNRSATVNYILKEYFQREGVDQLFVAIKAKLLEDADFTAHISGTASRAIQQEYR